MVIGCYTGRGLALARRLAACGVAAPRAPTRPEWPREASMLVLSDTLCAGELDTVVVFGPLEWKGILCTRVVMPRCDGCFVPGRVKTCRAIPDKLPIVPRLTIIISQSPQMQHADRDDRRRIQNA